MTRIKKIVPCQHMAAFLVVCFLHLFTRNMWAFLELMGAIAVVCLVVGCIQRSCDEEFGDLDSSDFDSD